MVYVFLGPTLPNYAKISLRIAARRYSGDIWLLRDFEDNVRIKGVRVELIHEWYDRSFFRDYEYFSPLDGIFRGGFWMHAIERFFVLEQFCREKEIRSFFHAELDVLIISPEGLADSLDQSGSGMFVPTEGPLRAIASLVYFNDVTVLKGLRSFIVANPQLGNEMKILGHFLSTPDTKSFAMKSDRMFDPEWPFGHRFATVQEKIVDSSAFGHWLLGQDPRNIGGISWNHFKGDLSFPIEEMRFRSNIGGTKLTVSQGRGVRKEVAAIHVHSKTFARLAIPGFLALQCLISSSRFRTLVTFHPAITLSFLLRFLLRIRRSGTKRPRRAPIDKLRGFLALKLMSVNQQQLSERELSELISFLPQIASDSYRDSFSQELLRPQLAPLGDEWISWLEKHHIPAEEPVTREIRLIVDAMNRDGWFSYSVESSVQPSPIFPPSKGRIPIFVAEKKAYIATRHATEHWGFKRPLSWSFLTGDQIINGTWVKEMFPNGVASIRAWLLLGNKAKTPHFSFFQSFGLWALWNRKAEIQLVPYPHPSPEGK
jgi:hypothetical protein